MNEITIDKLNNVHNWFYDYSLSDIKKPYGINKIKIICKHHGIFEQTSYNHCKGQRCPKCPSIHFSKEKVIEQFKIIHGDKYDYSLFEYINTRNKEEIICKKHGIFKVSYKQHKNGQGCYICDNLLLKNNIIENFKLKHKDKYDYSLVEHIDATTKIKIICKEHGVFEQRPNDHRRGQGCPKCGTYSYQDIIDKFKEVHGDRYDYNLVEYKNVDIKVKIICKEHGVFEQRPGNHRDGNGCPVCAIPSQTFIIDRFNEVHKNKYDYSLVEYNGALNKINIICKEHGVFEQIASDHTNGRGCPTCANIKSHKEIYQNKPEILYYIIINNIYYKVGITKTSIDKRYQKEIKEGIDIKIVREIEFQDGYQAFLLEQEILKKSQDRGTLLKENCIIYGGYSEVRTSNFIDVFDESIKKYIYYVIKKKLRLIQYNHKTKTERNNMNYVLGDLLKDLSTDNITNADRELFYWQFGKSGSFSTSLFNTISYADINNLTKLSKAFPDEVSAFYNYQNNPTYWDNLCKIMNS